MFRNSTPCQPSGKSRTSIRTLLFAAASITALTCVAPGSAFATCDDNWNGGNGNWYGSGGWSGGDPNSGSTSVCITTANSTVDLNGTASIADLTLGSTDTLDIGGTLNVFGSSVANSGLIAMNDTTFTVSGSSLTLTGGGTVQMSSNAFFNQSSGGQTLFNFDNTIEGTGQLGQNGLALNNEGAGIVNANVNGGTLYLNGGGTVTNAGLLEATNGGFLEITNNVNNTGNITADGGTIYTDSTINGGTLNTTAGGVIQNISATTLENVTLSANSTYTAAGQNYLSGALTNYGTVVSPDGNLTVSSSTLTLNGGGTVDMQSDTYFNQTSGGQTLDNVNNLIEGTGQLGENGLAVDNEASGIINANVSGGTLYLNGGGTVTNAGLIEATNGGILEITNNVNNTTNITADGGTIYTDSTINGGTLNTTAGGVIQNISTTTLENVTLSANSTYTAADQNYLSGTLTNYGTVVSPDGNLTVSSSALTLNGGGTVDMQANTYFNQSSGGQTLDNVNNLIEGTGQLGENGLAVDNEASGIINANVNGGTLYLDGGGTVTNAGLIEATNGGVLQIDNTVNNTTNITADGGTIYTDATINGGTLNTILGGVLQNDGTTTLENVTLSANSTYGAVGQNYLSGTLTNYGTVVSPDGNLTVSSSALTLNGGGTIDMQQNTYFNQTSGGQTLYNVDNLIEGTGQLGENGLAVDNEASGVVNANVTGGTLYMNGGGTVTNTGLLEATNGGTLEIDNTVNNSTNITADGGTVNLYGTINGGTLNTTGGGVMNSNTTLNGVTLSGGSVLNDIGSTYLQGTITNYGTITVPDTNLTVSTSSVTLMGGGTIQMSGNAYFNQTSGGQTLDNVNNTIEGAGQLGENGLALDNEIGGTVLANISGGTLNLDGGGSITNNGTFEVLAGSAMHLSGGSFTNFGSSTLTGGTYKVYGTAANVGAMQIDELGNSGGEIVNNDATIYLNGVNSNLVDGAGKDALTNFDNNESGGNFTITNGRDFTGPGAFANAGDVTVGTNSTFSAGSGAGLAAYTQSAGDTIVDGALDATNVTVNGGTLQGVGTLGSNSIATDLLNYGGTVRPGDPGSTGTLAVNGNFTQEAAGTLEIDIAGTSRYSQLDVNGQTLLHGSTLAVDLLGGFSFAKGETFDILNTDPFSDDFGGFSLNGVACTSGGTDIWDCSNLANGLYLTEEFMDNGDQLWLQVDGQSQHGVPEPDSLALLGSALGALAAAALLRRRKGAMPA